ncbi:MAG TPA: hypothetical protein VFS43_38255 [Polyangiaceae bacterium]|nr:hypothetical protein [Polyangiaceae bacterium]
MPGDDALEVKAGLARRGPFALLDGLALPYQRDGRAAVLLCPFHGERTPSARLRVGPEGTLQLRCHGACQRTYDALHLVALARGLDVESQFVEVLVEGARLAGLYQLEADLLRERSGLPPGAGPKAPPPPAPPPPARPAPDYPPASEVEALWRRGTKPLVDYRTTAPDTVETVVADPEAYAALEGRGISPEAVTDLDLARVLAPGAALPRWARYRGRHRAETHPQGLPWPELGYRIVLPVYDAKGAMRSVRAWRVGPARHEGDPKRLPPSGCRADGLLLANAEARAMLERGDPHAPPLRLLVAEGEPDFLTIATGHRGHYLYAAPAVVGLASGSWTDDAAARVPRGSSVVVATHADDAGER